MHTRLNRVIGAYRKDFADTVQEHHAMAQLVVLRNMIVLRRLLVDPSNLPAGNCTAAKWLGVLRQLQ